ncbi:hypothetical protein RV06_GL000370 [Enterococcus haemoperoxidus]|nr:hypothetical protein RV06_GL000370 [Enterococcus haemoperoxidus]
MIFISLEKGEYVMKKMILFSAVLSLTIFGGLLSSNTEASAKTVVTTSQNRDVEFNLLVTKAGDVNLQLYNVRAISINQFNSNLIKIGLHMNKAQLIQFINVSQPIIDKYEDERLNNMDYLKKEAATLLTKMRHYGFVSESEFWDQVIVVSSMEKAELRSWVLEHRTSFV